MPEVYEGKRVAVLSWRAPGDPEAGGSELHAREIFSRWTQRGVDVTMFARRHDGERHDVGADFEIVNVGSEYTVFPRAAFRAIRTRRRFDALVEILNGVPFWSPIWWRGRSVVWLHHLHTEMWAQTLPRPIAAAGRWNETTVVPRVYRSSRVVTLADPGRLALTRAGFANVTAIEPGVSEAFTPACTTTRAVNFGGEKFRLISVGRLAPVKRWLDLFAALEPLASRITLDVIGDGPQGSELREWQRRHDAHWLHLLGRVDEDELVRRYQTADLLVSASSAEGWGMTITEAARCGVPAVVTDVLGHRAAVVDGMTGELVPSPDHLTDVISRLLDDPSRRARFASAAQSRAANMTWDAAADRHLRELFGRTL